MSKQLPEYKFTLTFRPATLLQEKTFTNTIAVVLSALADRIRHANRKNKIEASLVTEGDKSFSKEPL